MAAWLYAKAIYKIPSKSSQQIQTTVNQSAVAVIKQCKCNTSILLSAMIQQSLDMPHSHQIIRHDAIMLIWCITIEMSNTGDASWINKSRSWQPYYECGHLHIVRPFLPPSPHFTEPSPPCAWISFVDVLLVNFCYIFQEPINLIMLDCLKISLIFG